MDIERIVECYHASPRPCRACLINAYISQSGLVDRLYSIHTELCERMSWPKSRKVIMEVEEKNNFKEFLSGKQS